MDEREPVDTEEHVYRRIHRDHYQPPAVLVLAFRPNQNDATGISVFRERFVKPADILAPVDEAKRGNYYVARLAVRDLRRLGLTVVPEPDPNGPRVTRSSPN
jgi:hypothetical protein